MINKNGHSGRGTLAAAIAIPGTKSDEIISILVNAMWKSTRRRVKEETCDLSPSMILPRSKHTLMMAQTKWTDIQRHRVNILFKHYPILRSAYNLAMMLQHIFNAKISPTKAMGSMNKWYEK